jgi:D-amino-acid dehydrogenase
VKRSDILVVGGGLIGVCCAYEIARRGVRVTLLERGRIGDGAAYGNAGAATPGHLPINRPGRMQQAVRSLFDPLSPLYVAPRLDPSLWLWFNSFRRYCTPEHLERSMEVLAPLGRISRWLLEEWIGSERIDCDFRTDGYAELFVTESALDQAEREADLVAGLGYRPERLGGDWLRQTEPALGDWVKGGIFFPEAATLNPHHFTMGLAGAARLRHGADLDLGVDVAGVTTAGGRVTGVRLGSGDRIEAERVVLAAGSYTRRLLWNLPIDLPLQPAKGYHIDRGRAAGGGPPLTLPCLLAEHGVFCTPMGSFLRLAGTLEFSGMNHTLRPDRLEQLERAASRYLRGFDMPAPRLSEWCGLRPCLPDGLPAVGPVPGVEGLFLATGHAMMGLTLGPGTGQLVADLVLSGRTSLPVEALRVDRF